MNEENIADESFAAKESRVNRFFNRRIKDVDIEDIQIRKYLSKYQTFNEEAEKQHIFQKTATKYAKVYKIPAEDIPVVVGEIKNIVAEHYAVFLSTVQVSNKAGKTFDRKAIRVRRRNRPLLYRYKVI